MIVITTIYIFYREFNNCGRRNRDRDMGHHEVNSGDSDGKLVIQPMSTPLGVVPQLEELDVELGLALAAAGDLDVGKWRGSRYRLEGTYSSYVVAIAAARLRWCACYIVLQIVKVDLSSDNLTSGGR